MLTEEWRDVVGLEEYYQVSNTGRVWTKRYNRELKGSISRGYHHMFFRVNYVVTQKYVHCLVMEAFVGPCPDGMEVDHIDPDKLNNNLENLEYVTRRENHLRAYRLGLKSQKGETNSQSKLTEDDVREIRHLLKTTKLTQGKIGEMFGVDHATISLIKLGKNWSHVN